MSFAQPAFMSRLSKKDFLKLVFLPSLAYVILFFGGSEIVEHYFWNHVSETTMHVLHLVRGVFSVFFVAGVIAYVLSRAEEDFQIKIQAACSLLNSAKEGLLAFDQDFRIVSLNTRAAELLGNLESADFEAWKKKLRELLGRQSEFQVADPAGVQKLRVLALQSQDSGSLLLLQNITEEKKMEEQWLIAEKLASVGRMAAGLAHEIGTPLNIISGRAELIQTIESTACKTCNAKPICPVEKHIGVIFQQIDRISGIIHQLLTQAGEPRSQKTNFSIEDSILTIAEFMQPYFEKNNIRLVLKMDEKLPKIFGFPDQLQQVLINLLTNSIDATQHARDARIEITTSHTPAEVQLTLSDNGCGIPEENMTKIFDPFFTTKEFGKGTGLGLTVTANIIRAHGGHIEVKSSPARGTTFTVRLPILHAPQPQEATL